MTFQTGQRNARSESSAAGASHGVYDPRMHKRVPVAVLTGALMVAGLTGCQAITPASFTRTDAQADVVAWTHEAETALGSPTARVRFSAYETCRTDHAYFTTTSQWQTETSLGVPRARQSDAVSALSASLARRGWKSSKSTGTVTLVGPKGAHHTGQIRIEPDGPTALLISVVSPCYS